MTGESYEYVDKEGPADERSKLALLVKRNRPIVHGRSLLRMCPQYNCAARVP